MIPHHLPVHYLWCESDNASTKLLTTSYVLTEGPARMSVAPFNVVTVTPVMTGTAVTSLELLAEISLDGTHWCPLPSVAVAPTLVTNTVGEQSIVPDASARFPAAFLHVGAAVWLRVSAKRTGGDATSSLLLLAVGGSLR